MAEEIKKRRILERDFDKVEDFIKDELKTREKNPFRKKHEGRWKEVDRQISMDPMKRVSPDGREIKPTWHNVFELGELTKASEIITADVMRIVFANENWFEPHAQLEGMMDPASGKYVIHSGDQEKADGLLRSLMVQQHKDFGFKDRFELSIKEALHHGSFVAEVRWEQQMISDGAKIKTIGAPVWVPHSMWNSYPDTSPSVIGTNMFYTGNMILVEYMPLHKLKRMSGEGWLPNRIKQVKKEEHKDKDNETPDVKLVKWFGDVVIERGDGDIYLPNMEVKLANGTLVFAKPNDLPYPNVIYAGYERQDIRDPYYMSPIIKQSPMQKFTTVMANKFADAVELMVQPPVEYDGNDPDYVANGGPDLSPGAKNPTKSMGKGFKSLEIGHPESALNALQFGFRQLQEGLGVSSLRQGSETSDRQTATEAKLMEQGSEVRTIDFIGRLERQGARPYLYMQHSYNRKKLTEYEAYSNEMDTPDVVRFTRKDIDLSAHFDVVGAKGILGEQQRQQNITGAVAFLSGNPIFAPVLAKNAPRIAQDILRDAGKRNPEEWVAQQDQQQIPPQVQAMIQELQQRLQEAESGLQVKMAQIAADQKKDAAEIQLDRQKAAAEHNLAVQETQRNFQLKLAELRAEMAIEAAKARSEAQNSKAAVSIDISKATAETLGQLESVSLGHSKEVAKATETLVGAATRIAEAADKIGKTKRKAKFTRTPDGYKVEED